MDQNYAEVHRLLGQSESERQLSTFTRALRDAIPELRNNQLLEKSANIWSTRNRSWSEHLSEMHKCRKPPFYNHQDVVAMNNAHNVNVVTVNKQREIQMSHLTHALKKAENKQRDLE